MIQNLLLLAFICVAAGWSSFHKADKQYKHFYQNSARPLKECKNQISDPLCEKYQKFCYKNDKIMRLCKKTCGDCPAVSPMSCHATKYGCCWDNITISGANGKDCPACKDKVANCRKVTDMCEISHIQRACPETCGVCQDDCYDDINQAEYCPLFKADGFCDLDMRLMVTYCRKTCNLCKADILKDFEVTEEKAIKRETTMKSSSSSSDDLLMDMLQQEVIQELTKKEASEKKELTKKEASKKQEIKNKVQADEKLKKELLQEPDVKMVRVSSEKDDSTSKRSEADRAILNLLNEKEKKTTDENLLQELLEVDSEGVPNTADELDQIEPNAKATSLKKEQSDKEMSTINSDEALLKLLQEHGKVHKDSKEVTIKSTDAMKKSDEGLIAMLEKEVKEQKKKDADDALFDLLANRPEQAKQADHAAQVDQDAKQNFKQEKKKKDAEEEALLKLLIEDEKKNRR